ncbi:methyl-accepting chemotaxis protein [Neisseriaceae bacterium TC5R-5]|nr:methyl-accepting chemotaxis protein [Neisseriaceae bacterium TC5R-5]
MGRGKDIIADILPPPLYILEAQFTVEQLQHAEPAEIPLLLEKLSSLKKDFDNRNNYWANSALDEEVKKAILGEQKTTADAFWKLVQGDFTQAIKQADTARVQLLAKEIRTIYDRHRQNVDITVKVADDYADRTLNSLNRTAVNTRWLVLILSGLGAILAVGATLLVTREIMKRLGGEPLVMQQAARRIAAGDLTEELTVTKQDTTSLFALIREMQSSLRSTISQSREAAQQLTRAAIDLVASTEQVAESTSQQSEAAAEIAASIEEVTVSISVVADNAASARELAKEAEDLSFEGKALVQEAVDGINSVSEAVTKSSKVVQDLGERSSEISTIVNVIKDIAEQTNLLALNAAIEAARAGEQGRGFAVVADEVRKLAERTAKSTVEIVAMVEAVQQGTQNAVDGMQEGQKHVAVSVASSARTGESITNIESRTQRVLETVAGISNALQEQRTASTQIAGNVEKIAQMAEENSSSVQQVSLAVNHLEILAEELKDSVERFKI